MLVLLRLLWIMNSRKKQHFSSSKVNRLKTLRSLVSSTFKHWNAKKALHHVAKVLSTVHVARCKAYIPEKRLERYRALINQKQFQKAAKKRIAEGNADAIAEQQADVTASRLASKVARKSSGLTSAPVEIVLDMTSGSSQESVLSSEVQSAKSSAQMTLHSYQPHESQGGQRQSTVLEENEAVADTAIAHCIHGLNLSLSIGEKSLFQRMIVAARLTGPNYKCPDRNAIGGALLAGNSQQVMNKNDCILTKFADVSGIAMKGDGATIKKKPLFNIFASAPNCPPIVLGVHDCTKHLARGGKKDAEYIAKQFLPHMRRLDPEKKRICLFIVDGASNVQLAGQVVEAVFPMVSVLHGSEHLLSLFFSDIAKIPAIHVSV
jgi:hypothetical protein